MKVISFVMLKGGVGKTTASVNTAVGLANKGYRVLLLDTDPQANATEHFFDNESLENIELSLYDVLENIDNKDVILNSIYNVKENLSILVSNLDLSVKEYLLKSNSDYPVHKYFKDIIEVVKDMYDYIIIDCPPSLGVYTLNSLFVSDLIVIPFRNDVSSVRGFTNTMNYLNLVKRNYSIDFDIKMLATMVNRNSYDKQVIEDISESSFNTNIRYQAKPVTESSFNKTFLIEDKSNVGNDYKNLVDELEVYFNE